jgi:hypothetical protein
MCHIPVVTSNGPTITRKGFCRSELFVLKWKDIDFSSLLIEVKRSSSSESLDTVRIKHPASRTHVSPPRTRMEGFWETVSTLGSRVLIRSRRKD